MTRQSSLPRSFWILWTATTATSLGDGIRLVALPLLATQLTRDVGLIALVTVFTYLPALLVGPIAGVFVDRARKRGLIAGAHIARAAVLALVTVLTWQGSLTMPALCVAAFLCGVGEAVGDPAAHAILPRLVSTTDLGQANSRLQSGMIMGEMFVGRAAGGVLFAVASFWPVLANMLLLAAAAAIVLGLRVDEPSRARSAARRNRLAEFRHELLEGLTVVVHSRLLGRMSILLAVWAGVSGAFWGIATIYALRDLHSGATGYGVMLALSALGSLAGATVAIRFVRALGAARATAVAVIISAASIAALAMTTDSWLAALLLAFNGFAVTIWNVMSVTVRQATVEPALLGRVGSMYRILATLAMPLGAGLAGLLASVVGATAVFAVTAAVLALAGAVIIPGLWPILEKSWPRGQSSAESLGGVEAPMRVDT